MARKNLFTSTYFKMNLLSKFFTYLLLFTSASTLLSSSFRGHIDQSLCVMATLRLLQHCEEKLK